MTKWTFTLLACSLLSAPTVTSTSFGMQADGTATRLPAIREFDANHCEFYVDSFGVGEFKYLDTRQRFLDVYLRVNEAELVDLQGDQILAVGTIVRARSFTPQIDSGHPYLDILEFKDRVSATRVSPGTWQLRYNFEERRTPQLFFKEILGLSFFIEVRRAAGRVERLWVHNRGADFTVEGIFGDRSGTSMSIGIGEVRYPDADSPIYYQKSACTR